MCDSSVIKKDKHKVLKLAQYSFLIPYILAIAIDLLKYVLNIIVDLIILLTHPTLDISSLELYVDIDSILKMLLSYWVTPWLTIFTLSDSNFDIGYYIKMQAANAKGVVSYPLFIPTQDMLMRDCIVPCFITIVIEIILYIISIICIKKVAKKYKITNARPLISLIGFIILQVIATIIFSIYKTEYIYYMIDGTDVIMNILG